MIDTFRVEFTNDERRYIAPEAAVLTPADRKAIEQRTVSKAARRTPAGCGYNFNPVLDVLGTVYDSLPLPVRTMARPATAIGFGLLLAACGNVGSPDPINGRNPRMVPASESEYKPGFTGLKDSSTNTAEYRCGSGSDAKLVNISPFASASEKASACQ